MQFELPASSKQPDGIHDHNRKLPMNTTPPPLPADLKPSATIPPIPAPQPKKGLRLAGIAAAAFLGLVVACLIGGSLLRGASQRAMFVAHRDKLEVLKQLGALQHPRDTALAKQLCTTKGYQVWARSSGYLPGAKEGFEIVGFGKSGDLCDVAMVSNTVEGVAKLHVRLVRSGNTWRYDDVYLKEAGGREIGLWASYVQEHPLLASAKVLQPEIKAAYNETKAALKGTAETIHDVATIMSIFKGL